MNGLAGALRLSVDERDHLYRLAGQGAPATRDPAGFVDAGLLSVLTAVERTMPGFISDDLGTVVAQNLLNTALFGSFTGRPGREANLVWQWFTSPTWRFKLEPEEQHEQTGRAYVADLRAITGQREGETDAADLVAALLRASAEFAALWDDHEVSVLHCSTKRVVDDRVGRLDLDCVVLLSPLSRQRMLLMKPVPGSGAEERLALLDSILR
ncbi:transcriptional regulator [Amycolatopsis sp. NPDC021455]|uniref:MmyB family transcriptional regulator n=1 Tax=Amycolatopsis sp. NPDC021455 TaxID=3154901 RepID=UPI0033E7B500